MPRGKGVSVTACGNAALLLRSPRFGPQRVSGESALEVPPQGPVHYFAPEDRTDKRSSSCLAIQQIRANRTFETASKANGAGDDPAPQSFKKGL
jgi:hypothetical protein